MWLRKRPRVCRRRDRLSFVGLLQRSEHRTPDSQQAQIRPSHSASSDRWLHPLARCAAWHEGMRLVHRGVQKNSPYRLPGVAGSPEASHAQPWAGKFFVCSCALATATGRPMVHASLRDQLETFRSRAGTALPSTHEVLHIDLELAGGDAAHALRIARHEVLKWVSRRVGILPKHAWEFETFEHLPGGNAAYAVRLEMDDFDYWIARCDDPDKEVPGRTWTTEVSIVGYEGTGRFALRQQVASREHRPIFVPAVPGVVQQLVQAPGLHRLGRPVAVPPRMVDDQEAAYDLIGLIEDPRRRRPVIVVVRGKRKATRHRNGEQP